jgi:glycosyltransferase involved in cell wall biosynthesis
MKTSPVRKVSDETFKEILSFIDEHKNISLEEVDEFRQYSRDKKFIEQNPNFEKSENPLITVIITTHNQAHIIHKSLKSVQNQSVKNLEIIIVDDCSRDNTTETLNEYQKEDPRIVLLTHDMNEGSIKSRADGVRLAKGKYITIVDGDDALAHRDILNHSLYIAQKGNIDVIEFQAASFRNRQFRTVVNAYSMINLTNIVYPPELRRKFFVITDNEGIRAVQSRCIYAKLVRSQVFKEALEFIGKKYTDDFITNYEDVIMAVAIHQISSSYYYMKELGYYYARGQPGGYPKLKEKKCKANPSEIKDGTIYVTLFPCTNCSKKIIQSGISRVVYLFDDRKDTKDNVASKFMLKMAGVEYISFEELRKVDEVDVSFDAKPNEYVRKLIRKPE